MAKIELLTPLILKWEGGFVNDPIDRGGATNMGVTLSTWRSQGYDKNKDGVIDAKDIKLLEKADFQSVLRTYWNRWRADEIQNQSIANLLVDWVWCSGVWGIKIPQSVLGVPVDGTVGPLTLAKVNQQDPEVLFNKIWKERVAYLHRIVERDRSQQRFLKGWLNRLNSFRFNDKRDK